MKKEHERLTEQDQIKFIDPRFERRQVVGWRKARRQDVSKTARPPDE